MLLVLAATKGGQKFKSLEYKIFGQSFIFNETNYKNIETKQTAAIGTTCWVLCTQS